MTPSTPTALVLAGGGLAGIAWELGVLRGLADVDPVLAESLIAADVVIGTSAGSSVAAQITSGAPLSTLYEAQLVAESSEIDVDVDLPALIARLGAATADADTPEEINRAVAEVALAANTVSEADRLAAVAGRLPASAWPAGRDLRIVAVAAASGRRVVFTAAAGVALVDAVAASCAVPGVWPPATVAGARYLDGGVHSGANADLALGAGRAVVITPTAQGAPAGLGRDLAEELGELERGGVTTYAVYADETSVVAFGPNPLSTATRRPAAEAGRALGVRLAAEVATFWAP